MTAIASELAWVKRRTPAPSRGGPVPPPLRRNSPVVHELPATLHPKTIIPAAPVFPIPGLVLRPLPRWKRAIDIAGALFGLTLLVPILLLIAAAIRLTGRGPILFRQWRAGLGGRPFLIYKFRTMIRDAERLQPMLRPLNLQQGPVFKMQNDPRLTRIGRLLRKTSLDELPQLFNVLRGEMSLVGPRPLDCRESDRCLPWQLKRLEVTPGITGLWQVSGRSDVPFDQWVRLDLQYIAQRGFWTDLAILLRTIPAVLCRRGAH